MPFLVITHIRTEMRLGQMLCSLGFFSKKSKFFFLLLLNLAEVIKFIFKETPNRTEPWYKKI